MQASTPQPPKIGKPIQLVSLPWHKESPKDGALMLTATLFALCDDGSILQRAWDKRSGTWAWRLEKIEVIP